METGLIEQNYAIYYVTVLLYFMSVRAARDKLSRAARGKLPPTDYVIFVGGALCRAFLCSQDLREVNSRLRIM